MLKWNKLSRKSRISNCFVSPPFFSCLARCALSHFSVQISPLHSPGSWILALKVLLSCWTEQHSEALSADARQEARQCGKAQEKAVVSFSSYSLPFLHNCKPHVRTSGLAWKGERFFFHCSFRYRAVTLSRSLYKPARQCIRTLGLSCLLAASGYASRSKATTSTSALCMTARCNGSRPSCKIDSNTQRDTMIGKEGERTGYLTW